jgi:glycerate kinase
VVLVTRVLDHETLLRGGGAFEIATRARQAGVPAYAIAQRNALDLFETRILDLQIVLDVGDAKGLEAAAAKLALLA